MNIAEGWRAALWAVALSTMGIGCVANALRCGRLHCYLTGPFFLIMAIVAVFYGFRVVQPGAMGWNLIGLTVVVGFLVFYFLPERFFGTYRL
jgi:hypothetical protein